MSELEAKVAAAKQDVAAAKQDVAAAEQKYSESQDGSFVQKMAQEQWKIAVEALKGATEYLHACQREECRVLKHRPPLQPGSSPGSLVSAVSRLESMIPLLAIDNRRIGHASCSSGTRAQCVEDNVASSEEFVPQENKPSVITSEEAVDLASLAGEKRIVAFLLPKMEACFDDPNRVVVDSQDFPWLPQLPQQRMVERLKPDGFITHSSLYEPKDPKAEQILKGVRARRNGVPADDRILAKNLYVIEGKKGLTLKGQLELVDYMHVLDGQSSLKGVVIGKNGFWLIKACRLVIQRRIKAKWTDPGTQELFATFFEPSKLGAAVDEVCNGLGCEIAIKAGRSSFLGAGSYGHAFRVHKNGKEKALKVSIGNNCMILSEFEKLKKIDGSLPVIKVEEFYEGDASYAGYLMTQVGEPIKLFQGRNKGKTVQDLFTSLHQLHKAGYTHGDPRLENAIIAGKSLLWIDFMSLGAGPACNERSKRLDFKVLAQSIFYHSDVDVTEEKVDTLVSEYDGSNPIPVLEKTRQFVGA